MTTKSLNKEAFQKGFDDTLTLKPLREAVSSLVGIKAVKKENAGRGQYRARSSFRDRSFEVTVQDGRKAS